ncbi:MAG: monofunctional biosynthetic peptidoglycan transglycosylase [Gammaproteobacteria bacterium]
MKKIKRVLIKIGLIVLSLMLLSIFLVLSLRWANPPTTAFMLGHKFFAEEKNQITYEWKDWDQISHNMSLAVIAAEDQRFPEHHGIDFKQLNRVLGDYKKGKRLRGASTISQQTAKNIFLWSGRSYFRKGLEIWFTLWLEILLDKKRILELYLNIAEFGNGVYGAEAASQIYFKKSAERITKRESAMFAAVLPNPKIYKVNKPSNTVYKRQSWILKQMKNLGMEPIKLLEKK